MKLVLDQPSEPRATMPSGFAIENRLQSSTANSKEFWSRFSIDPRLFQITALSGILLFSVLGLGREPNIQILCALLIAPQVVQWSASKFIGFPYDTRSAMISSLSLVLLLRTTTLWVAVVVATLTIGSKFIVRFRGTHIFNPTAFGLGLALLCLPDAWLSPGLWGQATFALTFIVMGGLWVVHRASSFQTSFIFLASYALLVFGRAFWLDDPIAIPLKQYTHGAVLIFAFFMISDPRTTPQTLLGRACFAMLCALSTYWMTFELYWQNGLVWSVLLANIGFALSRCINTQSQMSNPRDPDLHAQGLR